MRRSRLLIISSLMATTCVMITESQALDVTITWNDLRQRMTGFGANTAYVPADGS